MTKMHGTRTWSKPLVAAKSVASVHFLAALLGCASWAQDLARSEEAHRAGEVAITSHEFSKALDLCKQAIDGIGIKYYDPASIDDTGLGLVAAEAAAREGRAAVAANLTCRVLGDRVYLYRMRIEASK
jgi:hypothetical protein